MASHILSFLYQCITGHDNYCTCHTHWPTRMRATAYFNNICIPNDNFYFLYRYSKPFGSNLCKTGLMTLARGLRTNYNINSTFRLHVYLSLFDRRADGRFNIINKTYSKYFTTCPSIRAPGFPIIPIGDRFRHSNALMIVATVIG